MLTSNISERYLYSFYLLGLSSYNPRNNLPAKGFALFLKSIPSICFALIIFLSGVSSFDQFTSGMVNLNDCLQVVYIMLMVFTGLMAFKRSSFLRGDSKYIWEYLVNLENLISKRYQLNIDFNRFIYVYKRKVICMLLVFSSLAAIKIFHRMDSKNYVRQIGALNLVFITLVVNFYTLFHVDLFNFIFETINKHAMMTIELNECDIFVDEKKYNFSQQIIQHFHILKLFHFKLWKTVQFLNDDLGGILTLLIIQNTNTSIQTFYWIIVELYEDDLTQNIRILSTYCSFFLNKLML